MATKIINEEKVVETTMLTQLNPGDFFHYADHSPDLENVRCRQYVGAWDEDVFINICYFLDGRPPKMEYDKDDREVVELDATITVHD